MRVPAAQPLRPNAYGVHPIAALRPLTLDPGIVAAHGIVRAAFDAVHADTRVAEIRGAAKAQGQDAHESALSASANLARRSAEAHATRHISFGPQPRRDVLPTEH